MSEQQIYVIAHHEQDAAWRTRNLPVTPSEYPADYYKIGIATDVDSRLSMLNSGTPYKLRLQTTIQSDDPRFVEQELHKVYNYTHQNGEWFKLRTNAVNSLTALDRITTEEISAVGGYIPDWLVDDDTNLYLEIMNHREESAEVTL